MPAFRHVVVIVFENHSARRILDYPGSPFRRLAHRYALLRRYDAVAHPSLPNYLALVSGSTHGLHHDCTACFVGGPNLADTLAARGLTWRMYVEQLDIYRDQGRRITGPEKARLPFLYFCHLAASRRSDRRGGGGRVPAIVAGPFVRPSSVSVVPLDHYSLLRTIEDAWGLPRLGRSALARPITGIWRGT